MSFVFFLASAPAFAGDCLQCHTAAPDKAHELHSSPRLVPAVYGNTGTTSLYTNNSKEYGYNCGNCHPDDPSRHRNGMLDTELFSISAESLKKLNSQDAFYNTVSKTCKGVYCHSSGEHVFRRAYRETPPWGSSLGDFRCQGCHGTPPSYDNKTGRENSHFSTVRGSGHMLGIHWDATDGHSENSLPSKRSSIMGCSTCHFSTVTDDRDLTFIDTVTGRFTCSRCHDDMKARGKNQTGIISDRALHINGNVDVVFYPGKFRTTAQLTRLPEGWKRIGKKGDQSGYDETAEPLNSARYIPSEKKCLNVSCHLHGKEVRWSDPVECDSCHTDFFFKMQ